MCASECSAERLENPECTDDVYDHIPGPNGLSYAFKCGTSAYLSCPEGLETCRFDLCWATQSVPVILFFGLVGYTCRACCRGGQGASGKHFRAFVAVYLAVSVSVFLYGKSIKDGATQCDLLQSNDVLNPCPRPRRTGNNCFGSGTLVVMRDGSLKKIEDVRLGDETKGGVVVGTMQFLAEADQLFEYDGAVRVTGSHTVFEQGHALKVRDSSLAVAESEISDKNVHVFDLDTSGHRIFVADDASDRTWEFADFSEIDWNQEIEAIELAKLNSL
jgi:hypothetical protein